MLSETLQVAVVLVTISEAIIHFCKDSRCLLNVFLICLKANLIDHSMEEIFLLQTKRFSGTKSTLKLLHPETIKNDWWYVTCNWWRSNNMKVRGFLFVKHLIYVYIYIYMCIYIYIYILYIHIKEIYIYIYTYIYIFIYIP